MACTLPSSPPPRTASSTAQGYTTHHFNISAPGTEGRSYNGFTLSKTLHPFVGNGAADRCFVESEILSPSGGPLQSRLEKIHDGQADFRERYSMLDRWMRDSVPHDGLKAHWINQRNAHHDPKGVQHTKSFKGIRGSTEGRSGREKTTPRAQISPRGWS